MASPLRNITLYGAGGDNIGRAILTALLTDGSFHITILARASSTNTTSYPSTVSIARVPDDLPHAALVAALRGQDAVVSGVGFNHGALQTQYKVIDAAVEAGVRHFFPSEYGFDNADPKSRWLSPVFKEKGEVADYLAVKAKEHPGFSWTAVATGIWVEWALRTVFLGIDPTAHTVTYWDAGTHAFSGTTLSYSGAAIVQSLHHPELVRNRRVFLEAFTVSQRDLIAELERQQSGGTGQEIKYNELVPTDGAAAVKAAHKRWESSGHKDLGAAYETITAEILMGEYGAGFRQAGKGPFLEDLVQMPKVTVREAVEMVVKGR